LFPARDKAFENQVGFIVLGGFGTVCVLFGLFDFLRESYCWKHGAPHEGEIVRMESFHGRNSYDRIFFAYPRNTDFPLTLQADVSEEFYRRVQVGERIQFKQCDFPTETIVLDPAERWESLYLVAFGSLFLAASAWKRDQYRKETHQEPIPLRQIARG